MLQFLSLLAEPDINWDLLVRNFGVPMSMTLAALFFAAKGIVKFKVNSDRENQQWAEKYALLEMQWSLRHSLLEDRRKSENETWATRYAELKTESAERITNLRLEKDMWRDTALKATTVAAHAAQKAVPGANQSSPTSL